MASQPLCLCGGAPIGIHTNGDWCRTHGWSLPLHPLQGLAFLFLTMFALLHFGVLIPSLPPESPWKIAAAVLNVVIFGAHILVLLVCMTLNPGDPSVRESRGGGQAGHAFDRAKRPHVILDQYCCICQVKVGLKSKHCSACNKCISDFDHHCKWLNNCIGGRNYRLFLMCVSTALLGCLVILLTSLTLISAYFCHDSWLNHPLSVHVQGNTTLTSSSELSKNKSSSFPNSSGWHDRTGRVFLLFLPVASTFWLLVVVLTAILSLISCALLTHLLVFHIYLIFQGLSTYEYIVKKREGNNFNLQGNNMGNRGGSAGGHLVKKGLLCPLKKWRRFKVANQILPVSSKHELKPDEAPQTEPVKSSYSLQSFGQDVSNAGHGQRPDYSLDTVAGGVYLGSPNRSARNHLPPIIQKNDSAMKTKKKQVETQEPSHVVETADIPDVESAVGHSSLQVQTSPSCTIQPPNLMPTLPTDTVQSPQMLSPPFELEGCSRHLSVSTQSLNSLGDEDDDEQTDSPDQTSENSGEELVCGAGHLSGSLTNLFQPGENQEDEENAVEEVNIVQSPYHHQPPQEQLFFCPGKNSLGSMHPKLVGSLGDLSTPKQSDLCVSDMCSLDPNCAEEQTYTQPRRRPSIDVLFIPLGSETLSKNSIDFRERTRGEGTVIIVHTDCEPKPHLFTPLRTSFLADKKHRIQQQQLLV